MWVKVFCPQRVMQARQLASKARIQINRVGMADLLYYSYEHHSRLMWHFWCRADSYFCAALITFVRLLVGAWPMCVLVIIMRICEPKWCTTLVSTFWSTVDQVRHKMRPPCVCVATIITAIQPPLIWLSSLYLVAPHRSFADIIIEFN